jgi:hypothetical protein
MSGKHIEQNMPLVPSAQDELQDHELTGVAGGSMAGDIGNFANQVIKVVATEVAKEAAKNPLPPLK